MSKHNGSLYDIRHYRFARCTPTGERHLRFVEPKKSGKFSQLGLALVLVAASWTLAVADLLWGLFGNVPKP